ncbi:MAG: hypothetical protein WC822_05870 [Candidatus Paceibacterota bacterium]|jgi:magnesium-transporting ATPase (P-type)
MKSFFLIIACLGIAAGFAGTALAVEDYGLGATAGAAGLQRGNVSELAGNVIGTALSMIGVLFFILMVYGGFLWMTAKGNEEQTKKAFNTITAATIGIVIVLASYAVTNFVFTSIRSSTTTAAPTGQCCVHTVPGVGSIRTVVADAVACTAVCVGATGTCSIDTTIPVNSCR